MTKLYAYILGASPDRDCIKKCKIPYPIDDKEIFFGPCAKRLREKMHDQYLNRAMASDDVYIVGLNAANAKCIRKIVWAGRVRRVMTFASAYEDLLAPRYQKMRRDQESPLHVRPLTRGGELIGYAKRGKCHADDNAWFRDLATSLVHIRCRGKRIYLKDGVSPSNGFRRDACMLLENVFFAKGAGLCLDDQAVKVFRRAQPKLPWVDSYCVFGRRRDGTAEGLRGRFLPFHGPAARDLIKWIRQKAAVVAASAATVAAIGCKGIGACGWRKREKAARNNQNRRHCR